MSEERLMTQEIRKKFKLTRSFLLNVMRFGVPGLIKDPSGNCWWGKESLCFLVEQIDLYQRRKKETTRRKKFLKKKNPKKLDV